MGKKLKHIELVYLYPLIRYFIIMKQTTLLTALFSMLTCQILLAQDFMTMRNGSVIKVKVIELGIDEIKYKNWPAQLEDPVLVIEKAKVAKIRLETGQVYEFAGNSFEDSELYASQNKNALKVNFFSPLTNAFYVGYERSIAPGKSWETELGIIGLGFDPFDVQARGAVLRGGLKFMRSPDYYTRGMRYAHILKGGYVKPEIIFTHYSRNTNIYTYEDNMFVYKEERKNTTGFAVMINLGKQVVYSDAFLIDWYVALGYGFTSDVDINQYGFTGGNRDLPLAFGAGLKIGGLF